MSKIKIMYGFHKFRLEENNVKNSLERVNEFNNGEHIGL